MQTNLKEGDYPTFWGSLGLAAFQKTGVTGYFTPDINGSLIYGGTVNIGFGLPLYKLPINEEIGRAHV